ncbi:MAG TPA: hypothetical protein VFS60_07370, partial [Thermoanaerobaculia bacterium]|nr:hypothetical protein [Thermoanaerobaculia bacterium]
GNARHYGVNEQWTQRDFWVTRWHGGEDPGWATPWKNPNQYLSPQVNGESIVDEDLVLWYFVSGHHHPTDEDRDGLGDWAVTSTHWFGLELRPHNFFERNPLGGPARCGP